MKKLVLILCVFSFNLAFGQDFSVEPIPTHVEGAADNTPLVAYAELTNNTYETQTVIWERVTESIPEGWSTNVCTSEGCIIAEISMGDFTILPLESLNVDIQFNPGLVSGNGMVELKLYFESDSANVVTAEYYGNAMVSSVLEKEEKRVELFPNPTDNFFEIKGSENVHYIKIINIFGVLVLETNFNLAPIDVSHLPVGIYSVLLFDKNDLLLQTISASVF